MHIMIDLETMSTNNNAVIVAIGAVKFNGTEVKNDFYKSVDLQSCLDIGMHESEDTKAWWAKQSSKARAVLEDPDRVDIFTAIDLLNVWLREGPVTAIWGNGATFDNVILRNAFEVTNVTIPWKYWQDRCFRTMKAVLPKISMKRRGTHHNALDDAVYQAEYLIKVCRVNRIEL